MNLENKVVVVTGGSAGLGEQICYQAAKKGAIVVTCARRTNLIEQVKENCKALSGKPAYALQLDVSSPDSVEAFMEQLTAEVGAVDVLVNNAGFGIFTDFLTFDMAEAYKMFEVNILGMMVVTQKIALLMAERQKGQIINIASMAGKMATAKATVYAATKFAVIGFSNALRLELKPFNIAVTTVNPGPMRTDFFDKADPSGNYLDSIGAFVIQPEKLAKAIVRSMSHPKREINQPVAMEVAARFYNLFPHIGDFLAGGLFNKK
ncbi:short-subunit dehydrogenase [Enterococcus sp. PF1-24]|uniref:SDR family NAD(P)-dependent oxidoreductase n=1 Tax=unclassified Enterococcus TaxID=2608891 RepID=UPI0024748D27|nr:MULTISPECIES: SDR family oxidoreductase [unclassified Enterococcus]MDH6365464.1 short-subunit dehydrogenase [Enterococcus sp. PFB1-1]MDH6402582.1 short-subunit dehydrogenase [Enterococcus sp. PF1-24]